MFTFTPYKEYKGNFKTKLLKLCVYTSCFMFFLFCSEQDVRTLKVSTFINSASAQVAKKQKTKRSLQSASASYSKRMLKVTKYVAPENPNQDPDFRSALKEIQKVEKACRGKCSEFELGQMYNMYGYISVSMDKPKDALRYYKKVVQQSPKISWSTELAARFAIAQLAFNQGEYNTSLKELRTWMAYQDTIKPNAYFMEGRICYDKGDKACALKKVKLAVKIQEDTGKVAQESWYSYLNNIYIDREDYKNALPVLQKLITHYPKVAYWKQMGQIYGVKGEDNKRIAATEAVRLMKGLKSESDYLNLAYLYLGAEAPYVAGRIIDKGMQSGTIKKNLKNYETLGAAWTRAKEYKKAITAFDSAAKKSGSGENYAKITSMYLRLNDYKNTIEFGKKALSKGGLKQAGGVNFDIGVAYLNMKNFDSAISYLQKATKDKSVRTSANAWLGHAKKTKQRYESIRNKVKESKRLRQQQEAELKAAESA